MQSKSSIKILLRLRWICTKTDLWHCETLHK